MRGDRPFSSIFLDSGFFIALGNTSDRDHEQAAGLAERIRKGEFGQPFTSDYVFDEAVTATLVRTGRVDKAVQVGRIILGYEAEDLPPLARLLSVDGRVFSKAWQNFSSGKYKKKNLSFTDHTILAQIYEHGIGAIASMDDGFDGLVPRIV